MDKAENYIVKKFGLDTRPRNDLADLSLKNHQIISLLEMDATFGRKCLQNLKEQGIKISFTTWITKCISVAVSENKILQGLPCKKKSVYLFDDVDITILISTKDDSVSYPYILRKSNEKSLMQINDEIRTAKSQITAGGMVDQNSNPKKPLMKVFFRIPSFIRKLVFKRMLENPFLAKKQFGTVAVASIGMMGNFSGWGFRASRMNALGFFITPVVKKPWVVNDNIEIREILNMTMTFDPGIVDAAKATAFVSRLKELIESGYGLNDITK